MVICLLCLQQPFTCWFVSRKDANIIACSTIELAQLVHILPHGKQGSVYPTESITLLLLICRSKAPGPWFNIKTIFPSLGIPIITFLLNQAPGSQHHKFQHITIVFISCICVVIFMIQCVMNIKEIHNNIPMIWYYWLRFLINILKRYCRSDLITWTWCRIYIYQLKLSFSYSS